MHVPAAARDGEHVARRAERARLEAEVRLLRRVGGGEGAPEAARRARGLPGLQVEGVVEGTRAGEEDGGAAWVEDGGREREGGDVNGLDVRVCVAVDLRKLSHFERRVDVLILTLKRRRRRSVLAARRTEIFGDGWNCTALISPSAFAL